MLLFLVFEHVGDLLELLLQVVLRPDPLSRFGFEGNLLIEGPLLFAVLAFALVGAVVEFVGGLV